MGSATMKHPWRYRLEYAAAAALLAAFRALPLAAASGIAGWTARVIGPRLGISRRARRNLSQAMPELDRHQVDVIIGDVWDNLGRVAAELTHLGDMRIVDKARRPGDIEVVGREILEPFVDGREPALFFSAHLGAWELQPLVAQKLGVTVDVVYRRANNPYVDELIQNMRGDLITATIAKGIGGAREIVAHLRNKQSVGMLIDQKLNDGIAVPFFGRDAMTAPALAQLSLRYDVPIIPLRCERLGGPRFRVTFYPPMEKPSSSDRNEATLQIMTAVNAMLEEWIRARPGQWLWLHRRWPD